MKKTTEMIEPGGAAASVYRNQCVELRKIFERAGSPRRVLCVALDYAKREHVALLCDGEGEVLKRRLAVENSVDGIGYLCGEVEATARRRKVPDGCVVFCGEDEPSYVVNFVTELRRRGYVVVRVNARLAKENRENVVASTDELDLLGIAKTLLSRRVSVARGADVYAQIRELVRARRALVKQKTAVSNRIHTGCDVLFPGFLDAGKSGLTPLCAASLELMSDRFSAPEVARRRPVSLAKWLSLHHVHDAAEKAGKIVSLAKSCLAPEPSRVAPVQKTLSASVELYGCLQRNAKVLETEAALLLAATPYVVLTSIRGIGPVLAAGVAGELGDPSRLGAAGSLCAYAGIVPTVSQTGGTGSPAVHGRTGRRCNHVLKDIVVQSSQKIGLYGPDELKGRYGRWHAAGSHAAFAGARCYLRLLRSLVANAVPYLAPPGWGMGASREARAAACGDAWELMVKKWTPVPGGLEAAFGPDTPLGLWREVAQEVHGAELPAVA